MASRTVEDLLADRRRNALVGWLIIAFLASVAGGSFVQAEYVWGGFVAGVLVLCILPPLAYGDPDVMLPWEVVALAAIPTFGRAVATFELSSDFATYLSVAALALIIALELDLFTRVKLTVGFSIVFVALGTLATAGVWAVFRWSLDTLIGTQTLVEPGRSTDVIHDELMVEFLYALVAGVVAGLIFEFYFRRRLTSSERIPQEVLEQ